MKQKYMKHIRTALGLLGMAVYLVGRSANAQSAFQNLNFEQANVPIIPSGQYGAEVLVSQALPGWTVYVYSSTSPVATILHNNLSLGDPAVVLLGPDWSSGGILRGQYSILLQSSFPDLSIKPAIAQTGMIPADAQSLTFLCKPFNETASVSFAGQTLPVSILGGSLADGFIFGANVSDYAGYSGELRFFGGGSLDDIFFSNQPIPEPSTFCLFGLGALLLGWRLWDKRKL